MEPFETVTRHPGSEGSKAVLFAFDLIELGGKDLRSAPLEQRKSPACEAPCYS
jgi:ATP-dependent DNA ligase